MSGGHRAWKTRCARRQNSATTCRRGELLEGRTWAYTLNDRSRTNIGALVSDAVIEDTHDIDRSALRVSPSAPRRPYSTSHQWISRNLLAVTVLGLFIGLIGISLGLLKRVAPGATEKAVTQVAQHSTMLQRLSLLDRRLFSQGHQGIQHSTMLQRLSLLLVMTVMGVCFLAGRTMEERADEFIHYAQIERYVAGNYSTDSGGAMLGGFHASAMIFARLIEGSTKEDIRLFVLLISGATILLFSSLVRAFQPQASTIRTLQFVFFPLLFPFWFLIYTDVYALMWLFLALLALTRDRVHLSGILMIVSLLVRQTYIVWLALLGLWAVTVNSAAPLRQLVTRSASFGIGAGLFLLFAMVNGGVAVGVQDNHPAFVFHTENLLFMLLCFFVMFLPLILSTFPKIARLPPALLVGVLLSSVGLYFGTFRVDHPNNIWFNYFVRNALLETMTASTSAGVVTSMAIALAVLSLCVIRLRQPVQYLIYPFAALSVLPSWLIEQRYYLPAFALFMLVSRVRLAPRRAHTPGHERCHGALPVRRHSGGLVFPVTRNLAAERREPAARLDQDVENLVVLVHRAPHVLLATVACDEHRIEISRVSSSRHLFPGGLPRADGSPAASRRILIQNAFPATIRSLFMNALDSTRPRGISMFFPAYTVRTFRSRLRQHERSASRAGRPWS